MIDYQLLDQLDGLPIRVACSGVAIPAHNGKNVVANGYL